MANGPVRLEVFEARFTMPKGQRLYVHSFSTHNTRWNPDGSVTETRSEETFNPPRVIVGEGGGATGRPKPTRA